MENSLVSATWWKTFQRTSQNPLIDKKAFRDQPRPVHDENSLQKFSVQKISSEAFSWKMIHLSPSIDRAYKEKEFIGILPW